MAAKDLLARQSNQEALSCYQKAYEIYPTDKLATKITKIVVSITTTKAVNAGDSFFLNLEDR